MTDQGGDDLRQEISRIEDLILKPKTRDISNRDGQKFGYVRPRFAATMILLDRSSNTPKVLMGKRNKNLRFMPGALVFPGGSLDRGDSAITSKSELNPAVEQRISAALKSRSSAKKPRALGLAAIREVCEESGLLVGANHPFSHRNDQWRDFENNGVTPDLSQLRLFARAITPPGMSRRFDTWFFIADKSSVAHTPNGGFAPDGELEELQWISPEDAIAGPTREITRVLLVELRNRLIKDPDLSYNYPSPQYNARNGYFVRSEI